MLCNLNVANYALISQLEIEFRNGLTTITGETGSGKSILLGALSLILGKRADSGTLYDKKKKCIVEGIFNIKNHNLKSFFNIHQIDYDDYVILRREIAANGKSRAFINDSPVTLEVMTELGAQLIDIHSQYQTLNLASNHFQMKVIDSYAQNQEILTDYQAHFEDYQLTVAKFNSLKEESQRTQADLDYLTFQYQQLDHAKLIEGEQEELEQELEKLSHAEEIKTALLQSNDLLQDEKISILQQLKECRSLLSRINRFLPEIEELHQRIETAFIELKDVAGEIETLNESIYLDPARLNFIRDRLNLLYELEQKHRCSNVAELIDLKDQLNQRIETINCSDSNLNALQKEIKAKHLGLEKLTQVLSSRRADILQPFENQITEILKELGMPNASFKVVLDHTEIFHNWGKDRIQFLFSANKSTPLQEVNKVASGGELSRLMLSIKSTMSSTTGLPTIIFDEIDTGISGEIAEKAGNIIYKMGAYMQIINITHLPQIASKGIEHYLVYKTENHESTTTHIKLLSEDERHFEIARMLSGEKITDAALENARILLGN